MAIVILRYWAAAKEAAGVDEDEVSADTLAAALTAGLAAVQDRLGAGPDWLAAGRGRTGARASGGAGVSGGAGADADRVGRLRLVLARSSFLIDGDPVGTRPAGTVTLADAAVIDVLPPFAGG